ncbi:MAG: hypothetical protein R2726_21200 [Acidimicrobiales bacterium]
MTRLRADKVAGIAADIAPVERYGDADDAEILVVGWGSTWGAISGARPGPPAWPPVARLHLPPEPPHNLGEILRAALVAGARDEPRPAQPSPRRYLVDARSVSKVKGVPFTAGELEIAILEALDD